MMNNRRCPIALQLIVALLVMVWQTATAQTVVSVTPSSKGALPGSLFSLQVSVSGVSNLHLYHVILHFDNTKLRCEGVTSGSFFPGTFFIYSPAVLPSDTARFLTVDDALVGTQTRSGSGSFFTVQFRALQEGVSTVSLAEVVLRDGANQNITHTTANGTVTCTTPAVVWVSPGYTSGNAGGHDFGFDAFTTMTAGVGAVQPAGVVNVLAGTYREQVIINKNLSLLGSGAVLAPPAAVMPQPFLPERPERPLLGIDSLGTSVLVDGFTIDGEGAGGVHPLLTGVQFFKSSGELRNCTIRRVRATPAGSGTGFTSVLAGHTSGRMVAHTVHVHHDSVLDFGTAGVVVEHPGTTGDLHHLTVVGQGPLASGTQEGIVLRAGAGGDVGFNTVRAISSTGAGAVSAGVRLTGWAGSPAVHDNQLIDLQRGVLVSTEGLTGTAQCAILSNTFTASPAGTGVADYRGIAAASTETAPSPEAVSLSLRVARNTLTSGTAGTGIGMSFLARTGTTQSVTGDSNSISGFAAGVLTDREAGGALSSVWRRNRFAGNAAGMHDMTGSLQDALENWWGHPTGPRDGKTLPGVPDYDNPAALGDSVTPFVAYNPWYTDIAFTGRSFFPLTLTVAGNGTAVKVPDSAAYLYFSDVHLTAAPAPFHHFTGWTGDVTDSANPLTVKVLRATAVTANFSVDQYPLTVVVAGGGTVLRSPDQLLYDHSTAVTLTAVPAPGYTFVGWSGDTTTGGNPLTLIMTGPKSVTATFAINTYTLAVAVLGNGAVARVPDQAVYEHGSTVLLRALPAVGWHFVEWTGDTAATADSLLLVMTGHKSLTARFEVKTYTVGVTVVGPGTVVKVPDQPLYDHGTPLVLRAAPSPGYHFAGWTGDTTAAAESLAITVRRNLQLTATFVIDIYAVTVSIVGSGSVTRSPDQPGYAWGTPVTLTAVPGASSSFVEWQGDTATAANPISFTVWGPVQITAVFIGDKFVSVPPESLLLKNTFNNKLRRPARLGRDPYPTWTNLISEAVAAGGFRPLSSESDQAGGMVVGLSFLEQMGSRWKPNREAARIHGWVRLSKWRISRGVGAGYNAIQRTLEDRSGRHTGQARGLDILTIPIAPPARTLTGERHILPPKRHNNRLFAEMVALKLNIAASQLGKTPPGFGELVFQQPGHVVHGRTVREIAAYTDSIMTDWQGRSFAEYDSMYSAIARINRAFTAPLDTSSWAGPAHLVLNGTISVSDVWFLHGPGSPPLLLPRITDARDPEEDFEDLETDGEEAVPPSVLLRPNYPNPFNPSTTLEFSLREPSRVTLRVYDLLGRPVATLLDGEDLEEGEQVVEFIADGLASGTYICRMESAGLTGAGGRSVVTLKMILMK